MGSNGKFIYNNSSTEKFNPTNLWTEDADFSGNSCFVLLISYDSKV